MTENGYYVYAYKDPRITPARIFYIGKGIGSRAYQHLDNPDSTNKFARITEIKEAGLEPEVDILISNLSEFQALNLEAKLISGIGIEDTGGILTNAVIPTGISSNTNNDSIKVSQGVVELSLLGLKLLISSLYLLVKEMGGILTTVVRLSGTDNNIKKDNIRVPQGMFELAQLGLRLLKIAVYRLVGENDNRLRNTDVARVLGLHSDHQGNQKDYLPYSILGILIGEEKIEPVADSGST